jgi:pyruvate/2-oxoglutarate dehydrogenase complex dihydrolipoamide dehydrogenase (E3) component
MPQSEQLEVLVLGSGTGGKLIAWYMAQSGRRTAVVERRWIGGSCPNIACMPSKNEISSATVAHLATFWRKNSKLGSYVPAAVQSGSCKVEQFRA